MVATILIAEDERDIRDLVVFSLRFGGFEVVEATNGQEAVEKAQQVMPDLILMDVRMPRMTGYDACKQLKSMEDVKHIPVIFLSAKGQEQEIQQGMEAGAEEYILKPFAPEDLVNMVRKVLQKTGAGSP
ncbi:MAG TPA: response regulator [Anaerolineae bacterium]|nr:response regulator [Anaerolineae bacterium]